MLRDSARSFLQSKFTYERVDELDLHSFPTRRSSDLTSGDDRNARGSRRVAGPLSRTAVRLGRGRSEEHTSELQSQSKLVCRLLLEKKRDPAQHHLRARPWPTKEQIVGLRVL